MMSRRYRWFVVGIFFTFMLLHQADRLIIGPFNSDIRATFGIDEQQMGAVGTGALLIAAILYPIWGYLYDRFSRARLLALASFIWGGTTWLGAIAPNYPAFLAARSSTGIDDSSYPGIYSLISDYFGPGLRGKVYGLLQLTAPLGYMLGLILALVLGQSLGWRNVFWLTGGLGVLVGLLILFGVRDVARGKAEPELEGFSEIAIHKFNWRVAGSLLRKPTLLPLFIQGFFGVFPLNVISFWFFAYLGEDGRGYDDGTIFPIMAVAVLVMAGGAFLGGWLGDRLFRRTTRGRLIVSTVGVLAGAVLMYLTLQVPNESVGLFAIMLTTTAIFTLFSGPNIAATIHDITLPEVRSTALAIQYFIESFGAAFAPLIVGSLVTQLGYSLGDAIQIVAVGTLLVCGLFLIVAVILVPRDVHILRTQMQARAEETLALAGAPGE
ncbi:MAG: MFS transporter [Anaerolineae bacterium]|nr:MFS transporter [Anaerolineae bacterium]